MRRLWVVVGLVLVLAIALLIADTFDSAIAAWVAIGTLVVFGLGWWFEWLPAPSSLDDD